MNSRKVDVVALSLSVQKFLDCLLVGFDIFTFAKRYQITAGTFAQIKEY